MTPTQTLIEKLSKAREIKVHTAFIAEAADRLSEQEKRIASLQSSLVDLAEKSTQRIAELESQLHSYPMRVQFIHSIHDPSVDRPR
jgi:AAA15 family ATPase/GTPase